MAKPVFRRGAMAAFVLLTGVLPPGTRGAGAACAQVAPPPSQPTIDEAWLKAHLRRKSPRIILTEEQVRTLKKALRTSPGIQAYYQYLYQNAVALLRLPVLERKLEGRRLLPVSRDAVRRIGTLATVYALSHEKRFLDRADAEIGAVCRFSDWNPSIALDYSEMAYGVAIGLDWTADDLPAATQQLARQALTDKALLPGLKEGPAGWVSGTNNWNQVCHGGLAIAAIAVADDNPALAAQIIARALKYIPNALQSYAPDGAYPEGASYWFYGTSYSLLTIAAFESAFNTDFGMAASPGFLASALFVKMLGGPSGTYFNYFDSQAGSTTSLESQELLAWFASKTGNGAYYDEAQLLTTLQAAPTTGTKLSKLNGAALTWLLKAKQTAPQPLPLSWKGEGPNPVVVFRSAPSDTSRFFLGAKGGVANLSHGNMDAGSFVFELDGVRWSVDLGMQDYTQLEAVPELGVKGLWNMTQNSPRWTLLSKSNFGHSTLTLDHELHRVAGFAPLVHFDGTGRQPTAAFDLTQVLAGQAQAARRTFTKLSGRHLRIEDVVEPTASTQSVTWAMMTQAEATPVAGGVVLKQQGKTLKVMMLKPQGIRCEVLAKSPPPLPYDMVVPGLKRLEFTIPATALKDNGPIVVELSGQ